MGVVGRSGSAAAAGCGALTAEAGASYTVAPADETKHLECWVTGRNRYGSDTERSNEYQVPVGAPHLLSQVEVHAVTSSPSRTVGCTVTAKTSHGVRSVATSEQLFVDSGCLEDYTLNGTQSQMGTPPFTYSNYPVYTLLNATPLSEELFAGPGGREVTGLFGFIAFDIDIQPGQSPHRAATQTPSPRHQPNAAAHGPGWVHTELDGPDARLTAMLEVSRRLKRSDSWVAPR